MSAPLPSRTTRSFRDLIAWQKAFALTRQAYTVTRSFPAEERFGLCSQIRRSAVSVPSNIAEGYGRHTGGEYVNQLSVARGSLMELRTQIELANELGYVMPSDWEEMDALADEVGAMLWAMSAALKRKKNGPRPKPRPAADGV